MIINSKILFLVAHPDDEAFGPAGTIARLTYDNEVYVHSLCRGRSGDFERAVSFIDSCKKLGASFSFDNYEDCTLEYASTLKDIENRINIYRPDVVYTHNISDVHKDHSLIADCCLVACRPKPECSVKELYFFEQPASTGWSFGQIESKFEPNVFIDITDYIDLKKEVLDLYPTETYEYPDARSIEAVEILAKHRGCMAGFKYAEAFKLIYSRR